MFFYNPFKKVYMSLRAKGLTLTTAESLTGGLFGELLTRIPGASEVYWGGVISYTIESKVQLLGLDPQMIEACGVVSREVSEAMAIGALSVSSADISIAVTGVAGPDGGTEATPIGTVWISLARRNGCVNSVVESLCIHARGSRSHIRFKTVVAATALFSSHIDRE